MVSRAKEERGRKGRNIFGQWSKIRMLRENIWKMIIHIWIVEEKKNGEGRGGKYLANEKVMEKKIWRRKIFGLQMRRKTEVENIGKR